MRRIIVIVILILVAATGVDSLNKQETERASSSPSPTSVKARQQIIIDVEGIAMRIDWVEVDPKKVELYSNLANKQTSTAIKSEKNCKTLVNGGFYSKENKHLGLLISGNETISPVLESSLFNGFLSIGSQAMINTSPPTTEVRLAMQSGPIIMYQNRPRNLSIKNDEQARRIVAATTADGKLFFIAFHREGSEFQGPYLSELPKIIELFNNSAKLGITNALNLDGGSASAFITEFTNLPERTQIGSYFCEK